MPASFIAETAKANNSKEMKELFISSFDDFVTKENI